MFGYGVMFTALAITWLPITHLSIRRPILVVGLWAHVDGVDTATPQGQAVQCGLPVSLGFYTLYFAIVWRNLPVARAHTRVGACWSCLCSCCRLRHRGLLRCWRRC